MSRNTTLRVVSLTQSSGVELNAYLVADSKPTRQEQKLKTLSEYVQQFPSGWKKRLELANLLSEMGQIEQAVEEYRQVIDRQQPPSIGVRLQLAKLLQLMGQEVEAAAVYESASANARNEATRQHISGSIALCRGDTQAGILAFESAASLEPHNAAHWLALAQVQVGRGDAVAALRAFDAVLSLHPEDIVASIGSYDALVAVGNVRQAQQRLSKALEVAPGDFGVLKRLADTRCRMRLVSGEEGKQTKKTIASVLQLAPDAADGHELLAYYHLFRGESANGVAVLEGFTEEHPNHPRGWYSYGRYLFHTGEYQRAAAAMLEAYRLYPLDCEIYRALCEILPVTSPPASLDPPQPPLRRGEIEQAKSSNCKGGTPLKVPLFKGDLGRSNREVTLTSIVEEMLDCFPDRWSVWTTAGRVLVESFQEIERGCAVSAKGTQLEPQLPDAWFAHGRVLALALKHRAAVEALAQGWELLPEEGGYLQSVSAAVWLGESYGVLGDEVASRKCLEKACQSQELMEFDPAMAGYWRGRALLGLGDVREAVEAYRSALSRRLLYPFRGEVEEAVKRLKGKRRKGSRSKA
ncbi:MAG: tetratricopeptide repeat protein [Microcoleus sp. PH2017_29_MFU_D_A]|uniref:tetratricopeptide repeat protein n=1 Tax=unclassified Microcoleus TaxID=2642155 RepID=UPI001DCCB2F0|nr:MULTISPECIES: tetratricopeptide repeat protein [unclassified Microcoleus]MCC3441349.1 tetratricopeptide repeat protein [Microcoleus sp. PH2017_03_ELD_O_A]MCC3453422.1 tetratricopeptide repeat protein [Microcoleus sp. PH2017_08_TRC_O_A]MCC3583675.1 tetratricopeptide repeat protein [Microcoleus sp. PH2017_30_WIL_O_A]MCC3605106.1 tetratricopeptide repeat protein [Microcoleus sp. PH2017_29_MFU_D_A]MCC3636116.1 tetratricopeptide repeat protein [Microcoleus sp. PH2017_37_MFU_D_B]